MGCVCYFVLKVGWVRPIPYSCNVIGTQFYQVARFLRILVTESIRYLYGYIPDPNETSSAKLSTYNVGVGCVSDTSRVGVIVNWAMKAAILAGPMLNLRLHCKDENRKVTRSACDC